MQFKREYIVDPNLLLYLPLYELDGSSFMSRDAYGHICTATGDICTPQGRSFDGIDDKISIPDSPLWNIASCDFLLAVWVKHTDHAGVEHYVAQGVSNDYYWFLRHEHGEGIQFTYKNLPANRVDLTGGEITDTNWHHVAVAHSGNDWSLYKDGNLVTSVTKALTGSDFAASLEIGVMSWADGWFDGLVGEVLLFEARGHVSAEMHFVTTKWRYR